MATKRDPWKDWGKGIAGLLQSGQTFNAQAPGNVAMQNSPQAAMPNPGTYDPSFDLNRENAELGQFRYGNDFARDWGEIGAGATGGRNATDLQTALSRGQQQQAWGDEGFNRNATDLINTRIRGTEDYNRGIGDLLRNYGRLGNQQAQQMRASGVAQGGATAQAARKRAENLAHDRAPMDTNYGRFFADSHQAEQRLTEDRGRFNTQSQWGLQDLQQGYDRGRTDAMTDYGRTGTDLQNYLTGQSRLAYYTSGQVQPAGVSILELMRRKGTSR